MATERILNVDDYAVKRYAKSRVLRQAGYVVSEAETGADALRLIAEEPPDLVLLDVKLPDISGFEVCRRIKSDPSTSAVLVLHTSATYQTGPDRVAGLDGGADAYLVEPTEPEELLAQVRALLRARDAERALAQSTAEWEATLDAIGEGIALLENDGRIVRANRAFAALAGRAGGPLTGLPAAEVVPGLTDFKPPGPVVREHGGRWLEATVTRVPAVSRQRSVLILRDVTERRRLEDERAEELAGARMARSAAEAENRAKDEFLAVASHELRNPLTSIMGWLAVIQDVRADTAARERAIRAIDRSARAQARLVNDLLDFSRITTGRLEIVAMPLDLGALVREVADTARAAAEAAGVALAVRLDADEAPVRGDADRLRQILWNLIANAIKFTPRGGRVDVTVAQRGERLRLVVADTGQGIDTEFLPHVFEAFRQADMGTTTRRDGGVGLGLTIVQRLVELHGGEVTVASEGPGRGAQFTVILPRAAA